MTNSNMPAMPFEGGDNNGEQPYLGLTKREHFAGLMMASLNCEDFTGANWAKHMANQSVAMADALLAELEKGNE